MRERITAPQPVALDAEDAALLSGIEFDLSHGQHDAAITRNNGEAVLGLMRLLIQRKAIPEIRIGVFTDPQFFVGGRGSSHLDIFRRNGTSDHDIFRHPHFLKYLRYFLYGPDLPKGVIEGFCKTVSDCGMITSGDTETLCVNARELTRRYRLDRQNAAESFYRLALECGIDEGTARSIRDTVMRTR